ncbi:MAG: class I SAM-dependent methyltransferase [Acidobacteriaceae bacterium]|nr:class I SAM-dependent methyltransferase [Acidobacteriaceae bacterium]
MAGLSRRRVRGWASRTRQWLLRRREARHPFDQENGTDTGGVIGAASLGSGGANDEHITAYAGVPPSRLVGALERWKSLLVSESVENFRFYDLGCGKGRALLLASRWPFLEAVGVELDPRLARIAEQNVTRWLAQGKAVCPVDARQGDATAVAYTEGPRLLFLYNPFGPPVVRAVLNALQRAGGESYLIYQNEHDDTPLRDDPRLEILFRGSIPMSEQDRAADPVASEHDVTGIYRMRP